MINLSKNYRTCYRQCALQSIKVKGKNFNDITRHGPPRFLDSHRKPEALDPLHKWIGTYITYFESYSLNFSNGFIHQILNLTKVSTEMTKAVPVLDTSILGASTEAAEKEEIL